MILKVYYERLQSKVQELRARFRALEDSFVLEKILEYAKICIENIEDCIAEARSLKITFFQNIHAWPTTSRSSKACSESSELGEDDKDVKHEDEETHEQDSAPKMCILGMLQPQRPPNPLHLPTKQDNPSCKDFFLTLVSILGSLSRPETLK